MGIGLWYVVSATEFLQPTINVGSEIFDGAEARKSFSRREPFFHERGWRPEKITLELDVCGPRCRFILPPAPTNIEVTIPPFVLKRTGFFGAATSRATHIPEYLVPQVSVCCWRDGQKHTEYSSAHKLFTFGTTSVSLLFSKAGYLTRDVMLLERCIEVVVSKMTETLDTVSDGNWTQASVTLGVGVQKQKVWPHAQFVLLSESPVLTSILFPLIGDRLLGVSRRSM